MSDQSTPVYTAAEVRAAVRKWGLAREQASKRPSFANSDAYHAALNRVAEMADALAKEKR